MNILSGDCNLVTLGKGLIKLCDSNMPLYRALVTSKESIDVATRKVGYYPLIRLQIHTEDDSGEDIVIKCHPETKFYLENGDLCKADKLRGKRLISIGRNNTYCIDSDFNSFDEEMCYSVYKLERTQINWIFINGIMISL